MLFSRRSTHRLALLIEVQSSLVRGSVVRLAPGALPHILFSDRMEIDYKPHLGAAYLIKATEKALSEMIGLSERQAHSLTRADRDRGLSGRIDEVHYILSSPWVLSQARTITASFDRETAVTEERVRKILEGERESVKADGDSGPLMPIEEKVFDVKLNGYSVSSWKGKTARSLEISYALTVGSPETVRRFRGACARIARNSHVFFHSSLLLQYVGVKSLIAGDNEGVLLAHVHGELTDVVLVEHGSCAFFGSYPVGVNTLVRRIAKATKTDDRTADSLLSLYLGDRLAAEHAGSVEPKVVEASRAWLAELEKLMAAGAPGREIPESVIVSARSHEELFARCLSTLPGSPRVRVLAAEEFAPKVSYDHLAYKPRLVSIYALGICDIM